MSNNFLDLAEKPIANFEELKASFNTLVILALFKMSTHPTACALAMSDGKFFGCTRVRFFKPIVFIALAVEPIFPG